MINKERLESSAFFSGFPYYTMKEACVVYKCHRQTLINRISRQEIPGVIRKGCSYLIPKTYKFKHRKRGKKPAPKGTVTHKRFNEVPK